MTQATEGSDMFLLWRDWEYLPEICLLRVLEKINEPVSLVQFGAVSRHWHSVFVTFLDIKRRSSSTNMAPMLLIPCKKRTTKRKLYSLQSKSKVSEIEIPYTGRFCGSCYGWLAAVDENLVITLSNPFKNAISIELPPLVDVPDNIFSWHNQNKIKKVVLSDDPSLHPNNYAVIVIYSTYRRLAFYKPCQKDWIYIDKDQSTFSDIVLYKGLVYAIGGWSNFVSFDVSGVEDDESSKSLKLNILMPEVRGSGSFLHQTYLVKSSIGNLYSIHRYLDLDLYDVDIARHSTKKFRVFKLILDLENGEFLGEKEVERIDGDIVFVGDNETLAVSALNFPQGQPNSIYFTDDFMHDSMPFGHPDIGIFHLKDGSFGQYYQFKYSRTDLPPYIWISPPF